MPCSAKDEMPSQVTTFSLLLFVTVPSQPVQHAGSQPTISPQPVVAPASGAPLVEKGDTVTVHATGTVKETQKKFWSTKDAGQQPFTYQAGVGGVITGWDQGLLGAGVGETRALDIPADEGYGARGFPAWGIPPNGGLLFEIEVLNIKGKGAEL